MPALEPPASFRPLGGIAVVARDTWSAMKGREALRVEWEAGPNAGYDSEPFAEALLAEVRKPGEVRRSRGDIDAALSAASKRVDAEYYVPHLAHASMEPPAATMERRRGRVLRTRSRIPPLAGEPGASPSARRTSR